MKKKETDIWKKIRNGDMKAFDALYDQHVDFLYAYGIQFFQKNDIVKDCIHDLFLDIYKYRKNISEVKNTKQYLLSSFKRKLFKSHKKSLKLVSSDDTFDFASDENSIEDIMIEKEQKSYNALILANALSKMSEGQRTCLFMRFNEEKTYEEIAFSLNISVESVRTKVFRAIKSLRKEMMVLNK